MAQKVSILDGEVNRNWHLVDSAGEKHLLALYHDCVTGARAAMLDYEEVPGSAGTTNLFNLVAGRVDIPFNMNKGSVAEKDCGRLSILRRGLTGFSYECEVNGKLMLDTTSIVQNTEYEYEISMPATVDTGSRVSGVTWYEVHTMRKADSKGTLVHRRFRDFCALHDQVESLMKGHHLRSSLPRFPGKKSKLWTNHGDMSFVESRRQALEQYLKTLLQLPHVSTLDSTRAFLGMVGNLREFSVAWEGKELGVKLKRASEVAGGMLGVGAGAAAGPNGDAGAPPVVTAVLGKERSPPGVLPGDRLLKVNGDSTELMSLEAAWSSVARATRPVMLHFLGPILRMDSTLAPLPEAFLRHRTTPGQHSVAPAGSGPGNARPPFIGGLSRPDATGGSARASTDPHAGGDGGQWSLRGMLPGWSREQASGTAANSPSGPSSTPANSAGAGPGRHPHQKPPGVGSTAGRGLSVGAVGPFGNGAGAAATGRTLPSNSRLFGGDATSAGGGGAGRDGTGGSLFDSWRSPAASGAMGAGGGTATSSGRGYGGRAPNAGGAGSTKRSSGWMPDMSRGAGALPNSASPPALWDGGELARPLPRESTSNGGTATTHSTQGFKADHPTGPFPAGDSGASADFPGSVSERYGKSGSSFLAAMPAWPPEQTTPPADTAEGLSAAATVHQRRGGSAGRGFGDPVFSSFEPGARSTAMGTQSVDGGPFGASSVFVAEGNGGDSEEEEEGADDENPFA